MINWCVFKNSRAEKNNSSSLAKSKSENPKNSLWLEIVRNTETVAEAASAMAGTPWGKELGKLEGTESTLEEMEDALDRQYYNHALKVSRGKDSSIHL